MITIRYEEEKLDPITHSPTCSVLGTELHQQIEEVLLPSVPSIGDPIFFTKKFVGHDAYRWEVLAVTMNLVNGHPTYVVTLSRRPQIDKEFYLKNILAARRNSAVHVLRPWAIVEVEFGHAFQVGKHTGDIRTSKRYVDTMQRFSMRKRRLAIVNQVLSNRDDLIQVIPISSKVPGPDDKAVAEVTSCLTKMAHYQKPSWAICRMMQTVTASRIMAPLVQIAPHAQARDKGFRNQVRDQAREAVKDALMYGVAADSRVTDRQQLLKAQSDIVQLNTQLARVNGNIAHLGSKAALLDRWARDSKVTLEELQELYPED